MTEVPNAIQPMLGAMIEPSVELFIAPSVGNISFAVGALAFLVLLGLLAFRVRRVEGAFVLMAAGAMFAWTAVNAAQFSDVPIPPRLIAALEMLRFAALMVFLASILRFGLSAGRKIRRRALVVVLAAVACCALASLPLLLDAPLFWDGATLTPTVGLTTAVAGLLLTEVLYRSTPVGARWHIKFLCLASGLIFAYDLFFYADAALFGQVDPHLEEARGAVQAFAAPLLAIAAARAEVWVTNISLSHRVVVGATTLIASGIYLSLAAVIGFWLRQVGAGRGDVIQVVFFVGALAVLAVVLFSGTYWGHVRTFVNQNFFKHKYDWRAEWSRFMATIAAGREAPIEERCVQAIADIVDSPGGAMCLVEGERCRHAVAWNFDVPELSEADAYRFALSLPKSGPVIDLQRIRAGAEPDDDLAVPECMLRTRRAWLVVPLWHRRLVGFVILEQPRAPRSLDWEDYDLLSVVGQQAASYLAESQAQEALEEAREFEIFNRRFAFVVHDVKNLVSQLSVLGSNFEKHGHRKAFREDVVETLKDAAATMKRLMERINAFQGPDASREVQPLKPLIRRVVESKGEPPDRLVVDMPDPDLAVTVDRDRLEALIGHLVQNALEAVNGGGSVRVSVRHDGRFAVLDVTDNGPGMERDFMERELFKPFRSTKKQSMGIGVYQCREYAREFGGNLEAISAPGQGTTMRVTLPIANRA